MPREIPLTRGYVAIVDDADFEWLSQWKWCCKNGYAGRSDRHGNAIRSIFMHREILGLVARKTYADHINGNPLDNRRENLRVATPQQNQLNRRGNRNSTSRFRGVTYRQSLRKWAVTICLGRHLRSATYSPDLYLGIFACEEEAARVYDAKARELFGEFAFLNFPDEQPA